VSASVSAPCLDWRDIGEDTVPELVSDALRRGVHGAAEHTYHASGLARYTGLNDDPRLPVAR